MITHLKLHSKRGFTGGVLEDLGKITVICGKNNSGKSTLLECILDLDTRSVGRLITAQDKESLYESLIPYAGWGGSQPDYNTKLEYHIDGIFSAKSVWYADDGNDFEAAYFADVQEFGGYSLGRNILIHYQKLFVDFNVTLLAAKRKLETESHSSKTESAGRDAQGILSNLFFLKNQSPGTVDHQSYRIISTVFEELSDNFRFDVTQSKGGALLLKFSIDGKSWYAAHECGQGLHELLSILYFCHAQSTDLVLIEEIENHLHPHMQKQILQHLRQVPNKQFIITTHSSCFLNPTLVDRIYSTKNNGQITVEEVTSKAETLKGLGYSISDNLISDLVMLVEGPSDVAIIEEFLTKKKLLPRYEIKIWALGGDIMDKHDLSVFSQSHKLLALIDSDPASNKVRQRFIEKCNENKIPVTKLQRYAIENYFTVAALQAVFEKQMPNPVPEIDPHTSLQKQLGFCVKGNSLKLARAMTLEDLKGTDLAAFLEEVAQMCQAI